MSLSLSSSILPSPIPHAKPNMNLTTLVSFSASKTSISASSTRKPAPAPKSPKVREFLQTLFFESMEKTQIKKKKMKEEKKSGRPGFTFSPNLILSNSQEAVEYSP
ncbi:hypothetical protein HKD37_15G043125 [Glycine soja]